MTTYPRVSLSVSAQSQFHSDPVDADDFDQSANAGSPGDVSIFRCQFHRGFTNETQRSFDPRLLHVEVIGSLRITLYADEVVCIDVIGQKDDGVLDVDPWFLELVSRFGGRVAL